MKKLLSYLMLILLIFGLFGSSKVYSQSASQSFSLDQRQEIYLVFKTSLILAETAIEMSETYQPKSSLGFAIDTIVEGYGMIDSNTLKSIVKEGDKKQWGAFLRSSLLIAKIYSKARREHRMPSLAEIKTVAGAGFENKTVKELAEELAKDNLEAGVALARRSSNFTRMEVSHVVDAYITTLGEGYTNAGSKFVLRNYFDMSHEEFQPILREHETTVREILEERLLSDKISEVSVAALLIGFHYGNQSSISKLNTAKEKFTTDEIYQSLIDYAISQISERKE